MSFSPDVLREALVAQAPAGATGIAIALSGGADSTALLAAAASLGNTFRGLPTRALHVDHGLQAAASEFRLACIQSCRRLDMDLTVIQVIPATAPGVSIEAAAREARYGALAGELRAGECLLTAHHREDQAETLLLQALRGAGVKGLSAMPACAALGRGWHLRPLLEVPQSELHAWHARAGGEVPGGEVQGAAGQGAALQGGTAAEVVAAHDPMNDDGRYDRVYLRRQVWPLIESRWPGVGAALSRSARHAAEAQELLDLSAAQHLGALRDGDGLSVTGLRALGLRRGIHVVRFWLSERGVEPPSTARLTEALRQILDADADHLPAVSWGAHALRRYRQRVFLTGARLARLEGVRHWSAQPGNTLDLGAGLGTLQWTAQAGGLAAERLPQALRVQRRQGGERLRPGRPARTQSVQHLCQSLGVLPWLRDALPMIFAGDSLIAVADLWLDAQWCADAGAPGLGVVWKQAPIIV